jgi:hypothetical protein
MTRDPGGDRIIDCHDFESSRASGKIKTSEIAELRTNSIVDFMSCRLTKLLAETYRRTNR